MVPTTDTATFAQLSDAAEVAVVAALDAATAAIRAAATLDEAAATYFAARPMFRDGSRVTRAAALVTIRAFEAWMAEHPAPVVPLVVFA